MNVARAEDVTASVREQGFVAQETWPDVSVMTIGFGEPSLPASDELVGRALELNEDDGTVSRYAFTADEVRLRVAGRDEAVGSYRAVEVRPGIQLVDVLTGEDAGVHSITFVVDLRDGRVTTADSGVHQTDHGGRTHTTFRSGRLAGTGEIAPRAHSDALVGKRIYYRYSDTERYEHIYLNGGTFVWHCIDGGERGLADVDETKTFALDDDIVIFYWKEGVMPVESFLVVDLAAKRSIGRMFCWENSTSSVVHIPFDSRFTILNETTYPND